MWRTDSIEVIETMNTGESPSRRQGKQTESLQKRLKDQNWLVRAKAVMSLGRIGKPTAVYALIEALGDENYLVRHHAANSLRQIGTKNALEAVEAWERKN